MRNRAREAAKFTPRFPTRLFHSGARSLDGLTVDDIVITSYGVVRSDAALLDAVRWDVVIADEAQHAKNPRSRTAKALRQIRHGVRLALTGTPVENNLSELWSIIDWSVPGLLGPLETFRRTIGLPIERDGDPAATDRLQRLVQPFLLRRTKADEGIAPELPAKIERDLIVPLSDEQVTLYRATTDTVLAEVAGAAGIDRRGLILKLLTGLKQITNHPAQFLREAGPLDARSGKLDASTSCSRLRRAQARRHWSSPNTSQWLTSSSNTNGPGAVASTCCTEGCRSTPARTLSIGSSPASSTCSCSRSRPAVPDSI